MKIAMVTPYDLAVPGGVNTHAQNLADAFRNWGHEVQVIGPASQALPHTPTSLRVLGRARPVRAGGSVARIALSYRLSHSVRTLLRQEAFDIVHLHEPLMPTLPLQFLRHSHAINVATFHAAEPIGRRLGQLAAPLLARWLNRLDARIAVSAVAGAQAQHYLGRPCEVIPNCINVAAFAKAAPPIADPPHGLREDRRTILFVGRQEPRKGLTHLLTAYGRLRAQRSDVQLVIAGPISPLGRRQRNWVQRQGWQDVIFTGAVSQMELLRYYQTADLLCAPATGGESFGLILVEAMAAGLPVVASDIPGYRDLLDRSEAGKIVPPHDPIPLAEALLTLVDDQSARAAMGAAGRQRAEAFSVETVGQQVLALYDHHLNRRSRAAG